MNHCTWSGEHTLQDQVVSNRKDQQLRHQIFEVIENRAPGIASQMGDRLAFLGRPIKHRKRPLGIFDFGGQRRLNPLISLGIGCGQLERALVLLHFAHRIGER